MGRHSCRPPGRSGSAAAQLALTRHQQRVATSAFTQAHLGAHRQGSALSGSPVRHPDLIKEGFTRHGGWPNGSDVILSSALVCGSTLRRRLHHQEGHAGILRHVC